MVVYPAVHLRISARACKIQVRMSSKISRSLIGWYDLPYQQVSTEIDMALAATVSMSDPRAKILRVADVANRDMSSTYALLYLVQRCHGAVQV